MFPFFTWHYFIGYYFYLLLFYLLEIQLNRLIFFIYFSPFYNLHVHISTKIYNSQQNRETWLKFPCSAETVRHCKLPATLHGYPSSIWSSANYPFDQARKCLDFCHISSTVSLFFLAQVSRLTNSRSFSFCCTLSTRFLVDPFLCFFIFLIIS